MRAEQQPTRAAAILFLPYQSSWYSQLWFNSRSTKLLNTTIWKGLVIFSHCLNVVNALTRYIQIKCYDSSPQTIQLTGKKQEFGGIKLLKGWSLLFGFCPHCSLIDLPANFESYHRTIESMITAQVNGQKPTSEHKHNSCHASSPSRVVKVTEMNFPSHAKGQKLCIRVDTQRQDSILQSALLAQCLFSG